MVDPPEQFLGCEANIAETRRLAGGIPDDRLCCFQVAAPGRTIISPLLRRPPAGMSSHTAWRPV